ncbi:MAG: hypothetical protein A2504_12960 [Bdellovibrionales bacterium RIFOXYD12_FULL_39_22]|nr:MAG: hypothetical protein A2385_00760 [Bdellovibrionales bacterium RIFOXYB1_FULL_39_21]OFZ43538.1 MAG: hypothetical protein A2485_12430 [Bdellovibrionales bacterium RIFOXYC12_FULL_39_17]OFZ44557.1 MAG: hypothetical protein A2404_10120 [Bdellovibrionales bacterium RIFOXYC1_FULL_39_130]OFZ76316.1 MAG: hypothetical protein A2560_06740 [Bdellovibrionales bacterium RIFOXYD1_FULL_39_84]OFZ94582.1 MAG: hypothetical protein A2504_12960 [Bdellovibrionales bacterium RIFOXYD12_FULL_39_22]HLE12964.1 hy
MKYTLASFAILFSLQTIAADIVSSVLNKPEGTRKFNSVTLTIKGNTAKELYNGMKDVNNSKALTTEQIDDSVTTIAFHDQYGEASGFTSNKIMCLESFTEDKNFKKYECTVDLDRYN